MNSQVLKILIDNKSKAAFGVKLRKGDIVYTVLAIHSAGTLNSAQVLMLSGIETSSASICHHLFSSLCQA